MKKDRNRGPREARRGSESSYHNQTVKKLRKIPTYAEVSEKDVGELACGLTSPEKLIQYFDLIPEQGAPNPEERDALIAAAQTEVEALPVQLVLAQSRLDEPPDDIETTLLVEYGPLHAYMIIGNLILEWDHSSLIIPHGKPIQERPVGGATPRDVREAKLADVKVKLLKENVLHVIAQYNKAYYFHVIYRSSHDFVRRILDITRTPPPQELQNNLKKYFDCLESKKNGRVPKEFDTHSDLDEYVKENIANLNPIDKEYLVVHYFMFHFIGRLQARLVARWRCVEPDCRAGELKAQLNPNDLKINNFRSARYNFYQSSASDHVHPII